MQQAALELTKMADQLPAMPESLLYTVMTRRMIDYGRSRMDVSRQDRLKRVRGEETPALSFQSLEDEIGPSGVTVGEALSDEARDPFAHTQHGQLKTMLEANRFGMNERELAVVRDHYYGEQTMKEISATLGVNESRVSQIHTKAVEKMQRVLKQSDTDLVAAAKSGAQDAFTELYRRHQRRIHNYVTRLLRDCPNDVEDTVQIAFGKAFTRLHQFAGDAAVATWITRIATNESLGILRKRRVQGIPMPLEVETGDGEVMAVDMADPRDDIRAMEMRRELNRILHHLSPQHRMLLERMRDGYSNEEVGNETGQARDTAKNARFRAITQARQIMDELEAGTLEAVDDEQAPPGPEPAQRRCSPCQKQGRYRFADGEHEGVPMCSWCLRDAKQAGSPAQPRTNFAWGEVIAQVAAVPAGTSITLNIPGGVKPGVYQNRLIVALNQKPQTRAWRFSSSVTEQPGKIVVTKVGLRDGRAARSAPVHVPKHFPMTPTPVVQASTPASLTVTVRVPVTALDKIEQLLHEQWQKRTPEEKAKAAETLLAAL